MPSPSARHASMRRRAARAFTTVIGLVLATAMLGPTGVSAARPAPTLVAIGVTPANPSIELSHTAQLSAIGTYSDGSHADLTAAVAWKTTNKVIATVATKAGTEGRVSGLKLGVTTVVASLKAISGSTVVTVVPDTTAPFVSIPGAPTNPELTSDTTPTFTFSVDDPTAITFCSVRGEPFTACTSPVTLTALPDGPYVLSVYARDPVNNTGPQAGLGFQIDTRGPAVTIAGAPTNATLTSDTTPFFTFDVASFSQDLPITVDCRIDLGAWAPCAYSAGSTWTFQVPGTGALGDGQHAFGVRASDVLGNVATGQLAFTVETVAPIVTFPASNRASTNNTSPSLAFLVDDATATSVCRLVTNGSPAGAFAPCSSPFTAPSVLADGGHTFEVIATDAIGNVGATAQFAFTVDTHPPFVTIPGAPTNPELTSDSTPTFTFSVDDPTAITFCSVRGDPFTACTSPVTLTTLPDGPYVLSIFARDTAGNTGPIENFGFQIDTSGTP